MSWAPPNYVSKTSTQPCLFVNSYVHSSTIDNAESCVLLLPYDVCSTCFDVFLQTQSVPPGGYQPPPGGYQPPPGGYQPPPGGYQPPPGGYHPSSGPKYPQQGNPPPGVGGYNQPYQQEVSAKGLQRSCFAMTMTYMNWTSCYRDQLVAVLEGIFRLTTRYCCMFMRLYISFSLLIIGISLYPTLRTSLSMEIPRLHNSNQLDLPQELTPPSGSGFR